MRRSCAASMLGCGPARSRIGRQAVLVLALVLTGWGGAAPARSAGGKPLAPASIERAPRSSECDGVSFAEEPDRLYVPLREAVARLGWTLAVSSTGAATVAGQAVAASDLRRLPDGALLLPVRDLLDPGAGIDRNLETGAIRVDGGSRSFTVRQGRKRVEISLGRQELRAWQGERLVLRTPCSTGRAGYPTPPGEFYATDRQRMVISQKYGNAEMPWSVQVYGDIYIHGSKSVPPRAASHGCIRLPLTGANPSRWFYEWAEVGTAIVIAN